ncbi:MAG: aspartate kinase [Planctomycetes bacterium]|nr:aspartate kinase [Planctomycetota bacterium]
MRCGGVIVVKFGGSVLRSEDSLRLAVHEVLRWRRDGVRVVAVVSALAGRTDALFAECRSTGLGAGTYATAARVACGEAESAARLGVELDATGIEAAVLSPGTIGLLAEGDPLDADPIGVDAVRLRGVLEGQGVVVVPGYVACDRSGRTVLLGRGGSDLTALCLAHALGARCRLVKDVDGLYEHDPLRPGPRARRYAQARWVDALATDGSIVQHKAAEFALRHSIEFELGRLGGDTPTLIGTGGPRWADDGERRPPLRVAVLGTGTVGGGVLEALAQLREQFTVVAIAARGVSRLHPHEAARCGADVVVECLGGTETARECILAALATGADVVTSNKAVLAAHGDEIATAAREAGRSVSASAAVGGSTPVLTRVARGRTEGRGLRRVTGVLNGTANFVLERVRQGDTLAAAIDVARRLGLAERDPARDLDGRDAVDKLAVVAATAGFAGLPATSICRETIDEAVAERVRRAGRLRLRQVARLVRVAGELRGSVAIEAVSDDHPLHAVPSEWNAVVLEWDDGSREVLRGRGAGRRPTAAAVVGDLLDLHRAASRNAIQCGVPGPAEVNDVVVL